MGYRYAHFNGTTIARPTTGTDAIWKFRQFMLEATGGSSPAASGGPAWTCPKDGDGTTYSSSGTQITGSGSGANGMGNNLAWWNLKSPSGTHNFIFQRGSTDLLWRVKYSPLDYSVDSSTSGNRGFEPPTTTGGSRTSLGADDKILLGGGTDASPTFATLFDTNGTYNWEIKADDASPYTWLAWSTISGSATTSAVKTAMMFDYATQANAADTEPWCMFVGYNSGGTVLNYAASGTDRAVTCWQCRGSPGGSTQVWCTSMGWNVLGYAPSGAATTFGTTSAPISPYADAKDWGFPILIGNLTAGQGIKGFSTLFQWIAPARNAGTAYTASTSNDMYSFGYSATSWDGSSPIT